MTARFGLGLQADDIAAINIYIANDKPKTSAAAKIRDEWIIWHDGLGFWEKETDRTVYDKARNIRNRYNLANAQTPAEKEAVRRVQQTGLTSEEMRGEAKRTLTSGGYSEEEGGILPSSFKLGVATTLGVIVGSWIVFKLYVPDIKGWLKKAKGYASTQF